MSELAISVEDRLDILDVLARWCHAADQRDRVTLRSLLTEDAKLLIATERTGGKDEGPQVIEVMLGAGIERGQLRRHVRNTVFVELGDDQVSTRSYYLITSVLSGARPRLVASGVYEDTFVRTPSGWRLCQRMAYPDGDFVEPPRA